MDRNGYSRRQHFPDGASRDWTEEKDLFPVGWVSISQGGPIANQVSPGTIPVLPGMNHLDEVASPSASCYSPQFDRITDRQEPIP